jgi:hypothetical protein
MTSYDTVVLTWRCSGRSPFLASLGQAFAAERQYRYLPTLIVWCVRDTKEVDVLVGNLVNELTPAHSGRAWFCPRSIGFTAAQRRAVSLFLEWYREREKTQWASIGADPPDNAAGAIRFWGEAG